ncbi:hypothetical protein NKR23_g12502 [Pleurostoma richardsiae]|uniref:Uncharacterized protein n=1 Tax=Pleurostoma richardsiae TaxID=41990 RepID=A0AA38R1I4_9PEZI|nr:hypothetical protein NKR23_g12502 [Pleurostoma richardsiae]
MVLHKRDRYTLEKFDPPARQGRDQDLQQLRLTTRALYIGGLSMYKWGVIADFMTAAKERILSHPLPAAPSGASLPLLIPYLLELITGGKLRATEVYLTLRCDPHLFADETIIQGYRELQQGAADQSEGAAA